MNTMVRELSFVFIFQTQSSNSSAPTAWHRCDSQLSTNIGNEKIQFREDFKKSRDRARSGSCPQGTRESFFGIITWNCASNHQNVEELDFYLYSDRGNWCRSRCRRWEILLGLLLQSGLDVYELRTSNEFQYTKYYLWYSPLPFFPLVFPLSS